MEDLSMNIWKEIFSYLIDPHHIELGNFETEIRLQLIFLRRTSKHLHEICRQFTYLHPMPPNEDYSGAQDSLCSYFASEGLLSCLIYWRENGGRWDKYTSIVSAEKGYLEILKYALENGCEADPLVPATAAKNGHLHILKYLHEQQNFPWDSLTCTAAAEGGHLECLKYAHRSGCPLDARACREATSHNHMNCVNYIHYNTKTDCSHNQLRQENVTAEYQTRGVRSAYQNQPLNYNSNLNFRRLYIPCYRYVIE